MPNPIKIIYGSIIALLILIIATSAINAPDYRTVKIKELELTLTTNKTEYTLGETAIINVYLTNNHPYKVQVTLPDYITHNQVTINWIMGEVVGITPIEERNQTITIDPYTDHYLTTFTHQQRRTGLYKIQVGCERLHQTLIINVTSPNATTHYYTEGLEFWIPSKLTSVNYTGLPTGENVRIHPESHIITGDTFQIIYENNRDENLYWGSDWSAEKWVDGEWITPNYTWIFTLELRFSDPHSTVVDSFKSPFDTGVYRITKQIMLTNNYDRENHKWIDQFTATFYIIKIQ